ncbi:MAG: YfgM family protein [Gammaproteobacteria bacterium]
MDYETEEQQVEALKRWWKENGKLVITGVILGLALVVGVRFYNQYTIERAESASFLFDQLISNQTDSEQDGKAIDDRLLAEYASTAYATLSAMVVAKTMVSEGDLAGARQKLQWVLDNSRHVELQHIARLRLMRVLNSMNEYDQALALTNIDYPNSFAALYEELKGDAYLAKGNINQARVAYDKAILNAGVQSNRWLKLKRDDLGDIDLDEPSA